jgi:hypothetical protein
VRNAEIDPVERGSGTETLGETTRLDEQVGRCEGVHGLTVSAGVRRRVGRRIEIRIARLRLWDEDGPTGELAESG